MKRRDLLKNGIIVLAGSLVYPTIALSQTLQEPAKLLKKRSDLARISDLELLARMIFGEARNLDYLEKIWIAHTALNRKCDKKNYNGEGSLKDVLLKRDNINGKIIDQYNCFSNFKDRPNLYKNFKKNTQPRSLWSIEMGRKQNFGREYSRRRFKI